MTKVLVIEDERYFANLLKQSLEKEDRYVEAAATLDEGLEREQKEGFDVVLTDVYLGGRSALDDQVIDRFRSIDPHLPVIVMTSRHQTETTIKAAKGGAYEYLAKPYDYFAKPDASDFDDSSPQNWRWVSELANLIEKAATSRAEIKRLTLKVRLPLDTASTETGGEDRMVGKSRAMQDVFKAIGRAAAGNFTVLIRGETGTGKELAARALYSHSSRARQPFIIVNCAAIPENLLESELFGHEAGAFTGAATRRIGRFEQADRGTIFLDEIGDMSVSLQQKLLRVLEEGTIERLGGKEHLRVDVRVIAATHRDLELAMQQNEFRTDLFFRLNVAVIYLPALRERREDIPDLIDYFFQRFGAELGSTNPIITPEAVELLRQQLWPGNVRHLRNVVRKAILRSGGFAIGTEVIDSVLAQTTPPRPAADQTFAEYVAELLARAQSGELENVHEILTATVQRELYAQAIHRAVGDQSKAARWLGVSRPTMLDKLNRFGLHPSSSLKGN